MLARRRSLYGFEMREDDRRRNEPGRRTYNVKQLWQRNHEVLKLSLLGYKAKDIAQLLGISAQTVSNTINSDLGMQKLSAMRAARDKDAVDVVKEVERLFPKALAVYESLLDDKQANPSLRKEVADTVLMDIGGHKAPTKLQGQFASLHLSRTEIEEVKRRGLEASKLVGLPMIEDNNGNGEET